MNGECQGRAGSLERDYFLPPFLLYSLFHLCLLFSLPQRSCERLGLRPTAVFLGLASGEERAVVVRSGVLRRLPDHAIPTVPMRSRLPTGSRGARLPLLQSPPGKRPSGSKLLFSFSPSLQRSLTELSPKFGVWGDASVRWMRVRAGGGAGWAQNITHMFPVHPPKA